MFWSAAAVAVAVTSGSPLSASLSGVRMIQTAENASATAMTPAEIDALATAGRRFIDVTDLHLVAPERVAARRAAAIAAIPTELRHEDYVRSMFDDVTDKDLEATTTHLSAYFNRYYDNSYGVEAVGWVEAEYKRAAGTRFGLDVDIQLFEHTWMQPSLIVSITGARGGPDSAETVIIGAHVDSIAGGSGNPAPGADDNGSGSAAVLQVFRALMKAGFVPDRTVEFHHYAAEEVGLRGSQAIAQQYSREDRKVVAMMNLDMTGYTRARGGAGGIFTDFTDPSLTAFIRTCWTGYATIPFEDSKCGYGCSDHASFFYAGFPACHPGEAPMGSNTPYLHTTQDTVDKIDFAHSAELARVGLGYVVEMGYTSGAN